MTKVLFLFNEMGNDLFAYFPELLADKMNCRLCYSHIGQHSACAEEYAKESREANYNEYAELLGELVQIGYKDLSILNQQLFTYHRKPNVAEIKFGEGATHYRDFTAAECIDKKGRIKKWLKADDGQRYYY